MIAELRAERLDLHVRATFVKPGDNVQATRDVIAGYLPKPAPTEQQREIRAAEAASYLGRAFDDGFVEVG